MSIVASPAKVVVIHGAMRTGKTMHAEKFARHYGCARAVDWARCHKPHPAPQDGDLLLTTEPPAVIQKAFPEATIVPINNARRAVSLGDAPDAGFPLSAGAPVTAADFSAIGVTLPLTNAGDGEIIDLRDQVVIQVDPHCALPDDLVAQIVDLIVRTINATEFSA